jgi:signal peptidase I
MQPETPPPLQKPSPASMHWGTKLVIGLALIPALLIGALSVLRFCGFVHPYSVPTGAMAPAVSAGDHIMTERFTYLFREPRRGDVAAFTGNGIPGLQPATIYLKRVAGEPGEHVRISEGKLFVNDKPVSLSNEMGEISYNVPPHAALVAPKQDVNVPEASYFVLGDNSTNSLDSRYWGNLPRGNIRGRVAFRYWPPRRIGWVK